MRRWSAAGGIGAGLSEAGEVGGGCGDGPV